MRVRRQVCGFSKGAYIDVRDRRENAKATKEVGLFLSRSRFQMRVRREACGFLAGVYKKYVTAGKTQRRQSITKYFKATFNKK
ncbi:MAG: hypothetical protein IIX01_00445 [Clostridia bacterium]|nr:hypothetical protein [Clostridia bacterium]